jgi:hypothetical protein
MERLRADYTEMWLPSPVCLLVQFADRVRALSSTGLDLVGIEGIEAPRPTIEALSRFDEIVSWYGANRPEFREAAFAANPNWRFLPALPPAESTAHITDFYAQSAGTPCGLQPVVRVSPVHQRRSVVIQPFSGSPRKNWPLDRFKQLAEKLPLPVEWVAGREEELADAARFDDLWQLANWIAGASIYIGNDSGITHLAAATGVLTVALFGATDARVWAPRSPNVTLIEADGMEAIAVEDVLQAVVKALSELTCPAPDI